MEIILEEDNKLLSEAKMDLDTEAHYFYKKEKVVLILQLIEVYVERQEINYRRKQEQVYMLNVYLETFGAAI